MFYSDGMSCCADNTGTAFWVEPHTGEHSVSVLNVGFSTFRKKALEISHLDAILWRRWIYEPHALY